MERLYKAGRLRPSGSSIATVLVAEDNPLSYLDNVWLDTGTGSFTDDQVYVVQTAEKVVQRCMLMTTDPGDLVLDPTCGSGTTASVAEQWGRRWVTIDTSRVAVAIARQRLLTAKFDYHQLRDDKAGISGGFVYKSVPHITLGSIAENTNLDPIFAKHEPILDAKLKACNAALSKVTKPVRDALFAKLVQKERQNGKRAVTDADRRRWSLPDANKTWEHWTVPFDTDDAWPKELQQAVTEYRKAWRSKMDEVNACISANAEQEDLVDQPQPVRDVTRVSGPFTVEAVQPPEMSLGDAFEMDGKFSGEPEKAGSTFTIRPVEVRNDLEAKNAEAYLDQMVSLLKLDGVRFPNNNQMTFSRLVRMAGGTVLGIHADGRWTPAGQVDDDTVGKATVAVSFGPQYGPVTAMQVEEVLRSAARGGYDDLVIAGFSFDGAAQALIDENPRDGWPAQGAARQPIVHGFRPATHDHQGAGKGRTVHGHDGGCGHLQPGDQHARRHGRRQGRRVVHRRRLRRADLLHHAGVLPGQERVGEAEQGAGRRGGPRPIRGSVRDGVVAIPGGKAQAGGSKGNRPARQ